MMVRATEQRAERLGRLKEVRGRDGIVVRRIDWDVGEGLFQTDEEGHVCGTLENCGKTMNWERRLLFLALF